MAKNVIKTEGKTLEQIMQELKDVATKHNGSDVASERNKLKVEAAKLSVDYNNTSLLNAYTECLEAENPMLAFAKMYKYPVVKVSFSQESGNMTISTETPDGEKLTEIFNLWDFVEYCEGLNKQVTSTLGWKVEADKAYNILVENIRKYVKTGGAKDVKGLKSAIQTVFDAVLMIPGKSGNNAVVMTSLQVREIYTTNGKQNFKTLKTTFAAPKTWQKQVFAYLHCSVEGKDFSRVYGEDESVTAEAEAEANTNTEESKAE